MARGKGGKESVQKDKLKSVRGVLCWVFTFSSSLFFTPGNRKVGKRGGGSVGKFGSCYNFFPPRY